MKKFITLLIIAISLFTLTACGTPEEYIKNNMSEVRQNIFDGTSGSFYVTLSSGMRETPYLSDGIHNKNVEFGVIELELFDKLFSGEKLEYTAKIDDKEISGVLERNPFTGSFMDDIEMIVDDNAKIELNIKYGNGELINLENKSETWEINYEKAIEIAIKKITEKLGELNEKPSGEGYLKIINNYTAGKKYFWYFNLKTADLKSYSLVIDTATGSILAMTNN